MCCSKSSADRMRDLPFVYSGVKLVLSIMFPFGKMIIFMNIDNKSHLSVQRTNGIGRVADDPKASNMLWGWIYTRILGGLASGPTRILVINV